MAFIGLVFIGIFFVLLIIDLVLMRKFFTLAAEFKIARREKQNKKMTGNVFFALGILFAMPFVAISIFLVFHACFTAVTLPDGETKYVSKRDVIVMRLYVAYPGENSINALEKLLDNNSSLIYHYVNRESILDKGLQIGNADIVRIALEHGAIFDDPEKYEHRAYVKSSMSFYLGHCIGRTITEDDIEIVEMMFENNALTSFKKKPSCYSNMFGEAVWAVLYNDETVTDTELAFLQVFIDHGISSDSTLLLIEEIPVGYVVSSEYHADVARDGNYDRLMEIIGR